MEKGDWKLIIIIIIVLVIIAFLVANINNIFPTPTPQQVIQAVNAT
jgi:hypothetical protein